MALNRTNNSEQKPPSASHPPESLAGHRND